MQLLRELLDFPKYRTISVEGDKYSPCTEGVDDVIAGQEEYVQLPKSSTKKKKKKSFPTTDSTENSLINTLWNYQNADAS
jgi:hypothetical protein